MDTALSSATTDTSPAMPCPVCLGQSHQFLTKRFNDDTLVKCESCSHVFLNPMPSDAELAKIYATYHENPDDQELLKLLYEWFNIPGSPYLRALSYIESHGGFEKKRILDLGCGPGLFLNECQKRGASVLGGDLSPNSQRIARDHFGVEVIQLDLDRVSEGALGSSFDFVTSFEVIEHVRDPRKFIETIQSYLKPRGRCILSTPNFQLFYEMGKNAPVVTKWPEHIQFFEAKTLSSLLTQSHMHVESLFTTPEVTFSENKKRNIAAVPFYSKVWQVLRRVPGLIYLKDQFFRRMENSVSETTIPLSGGHLMCVARRSE